jgi:uncharacterized protein YqeY
LVVIIYEKAKLDDMGKVMGELKKTCAGKMDFAALGAMVKRQLSG